jgi:glyoxylase-like metal-dependent hydrolase (beta-lactamase superfamily II)
MRLGVRVAAGIMLTAGLFACQSAWAAEPAAVVATAIEKLGGRDKLAAISTLAIFARHKHWDPQETLLPDVDTRLGGTARFTLTEDIAGNRARYDWVRFRVAPMVRTFIYAEVFAGGTGYVLGEDNIVLSKQAKETVPSLHTMSASRVIAHQRELHRQSPRLLLEMAGRADRLAALPDETIDGKAFSVISYKGDDATWYVLFGADGLPARIRTLDADGVWGDSNYDLILADWRDVGGVKFAFDQSFTLNGHEVQHINVDEIVLNPRLGDDLFRIPKAVAEAAAKQKAPAEVNIQWMLRRANWGSFIDSDELAYDPALVSGNVWTEIKPGIWHITGGSHNTMVVEMKDHLVAFDAPIGNEMSRLTIAEAERRFPGKPFKYLVLTHHHMDHVNGARVFAAKGADLVFGPGDREMFAKQMQAPNRIRNDELARQPRPVGLTEVKDKLTLTDGQRKIDLYVVDNSHAKGMLIAHIPDADFGWAVDIWSPTRDIPGQLASHKEFVAGLRQIGIMPTIWAGGHGTGPAPIKPLVDALEKMSAAR